jgi:transposase-like protein
MEKLFTKEQARKFIKENNLTTPQSIADALKLQFKDILQEALEAELDAELGYSRYDWKNKETTNSRNGHSEKTVKSDLGPMKLQIPRDTEGTFEPIIVKKHERNISPVVNDMIISMYAKGMSDRDIDSHMNKIYGLELSSDMISQITDKVLPIAKEWQNRPLEKMYAFLFLDGIMFNVKEDNHVKKKTAYVVYAVNIHGMKDILGIWVGESESSKFWMMVLSEIKSRGVMDILIASVDGLKGFDQAIAAIFPNTEIQQCIVHQIRTSTKYVGYKDRKKFCADLKPIYSAVNEEEGLKALENFREIWDNKYAYASKSWTNNWCNLSTFFNFPEEIRKVIYTTNAIENFNRQIRKVTKTKSSFQSDDSLFKLLYLITIDQTEKWTMPIRDWSLIFNQLIIKFGDRITKNIQ